jgi:hypothetical protein
MIEKDSGASTDLALEVCLGLPVVGHLVLALPISDLWQVRHCVPDEEKQLYKEK